MRIAGRKEFSAWEWATIFGLSGATLVMCELAGIKERWADAAVYTVLLFTVVTLALRAAWGRPVFWRNLLGALVIHTLAIIATIHVLSPRVQRLPWLLLTAVGIAEGLVMASVLWKRTVAQTTGR